MSEVVSLLLGTFGQTYSKVLGIDVESGKDEEIFKWFLASILFGAPINETSVIKTFNCFRQYDALTPHTILETGWDGLVKILDEGTYTRYDFKTSDKLLQVMQNLSSRYNGSIYSVHERAEDSNDLERRLKGLGKGIGDVTVSIFLRELRDTWEKADPAPTPLVILAARNIGMVKEEKPEKALQELKTVWRREGPANRRFIEFETALLRLGKDFCRRKRCDRCLFRDHCSSFRRLKPQ